LVHLAIRMGGPGRPGRCDRHLVVAPPRPSASRPGGGRGSRIPLRPPEDIAREALDELAASGLAASGEVKAFYIRLSDILRRYIEGRFGIPAMDRTTAELLPEIRRHPELGRMAPEVRAFLDDCDLVKFAKYVPVAEDLSADLARARRVVDETATRLRLPGVGSAAGVS